MKKPYKDAEVTGRYRLQLLDAFYNNARAYEQVGEVAVRLRNNPPARQRVLIVEDAPEILEVYRTSLADSCDVLLAADAEQAEALLRHTSHLALAILDLKLPRGSGLDVAKAIRARWPECPIIVVSGFLSDEMRERLTSLGGPIKFFDKPSSDLNSLARKALRRTP